eukprot:g4038.t1
MGFGEDVYVVPLFSWYSAEFDKRSRPDPNVGFDAQCVWPLDHHQLWKWMLKLNEAHLRLPYRGTVLTTSHFVPLTTLPYDSTGALAEWSPALTIRTALLSIQALLSSPEPDDPQDAEVAEMYKHNRELFVQTAKYWTETFASEKKSSNDEKARRIRRIRTWGGVVPGVQAGSEEDMDDVLKILDQKMTEDHDSGVGFKKVEWCKAQAPSEWVVQPSRFGSHMQLRVHWSDEAGIYFE